MKKESQTKFKKFTSLLAEYLVLDYFPKRQCNSNCSVWMSDLIVYASR